MCVRTTSCFSTTLRDRAVFSARGRINREDWGVSWNMPLARGGLLVSTEIDLELEVELIRQP